MAPMNDGLREASVEAEVEGALAAMEAKLERIVGLLEEQDARRQDLEEVVADVLPAVNGMLRLASDKLDALEKSGALELLPLAGRTVGALKSPRAAKPLGVLGLLRALRDPDVAQGLGLLLDVVRALGSAARVAFTPEAAAIVIRRHRDRPGALLPVLADLMAEFGYVDPSAVQLTADELNLSRAEVYGVLSFYHDLHTDPPAAHEVRICRAEACASVGAEDLVRAAQARLGLGIGEQNDEVALREVFCLGMCGVAPAIQVDGEILGRVDATTMGEHLAGLGGPK